MSELAMKELTFAIIGAAMEVYNQLGCGFLEPIYQEAMRLELTERGVPHVPQKRLVIHYKGRPLQKEYVADFVCGNAVILEIKAIERLTSVDESQLLNYMHATGIRIGLLINFGRAGELEWKRMVL